MNQTSYLQILKDNLKSSSHTSGIGRNFKFYQDNDPKHTAHTVREWCLYNCPNVIKTPAQSPYLNPIENWWHSLDVAIRLRQIKNTENLKTALTVEWTTSRIHARTCAVDAESYGSCYWEKWFRHQILKSHNKDPKLKEGHWPNNSWMYNFYRFWYFNIFVL